MAPLINNGWLKLTDGSDTMLLFFEECKCDWKLSPTIKHYAAKNHLVYNQQKQWYVWKVKNIHLISHSDFSTFMDTLKDWMSDPPFTFSIIRNTGNDEIEWDGDNETYSVSIAKNGLKGAEKNAPQDGDFYKVGMVVFEQAG